MELKDKIHSFYDSLGDEIISDSDLEKYSIEVPITKEVLFEKTITQESVFKKIQKILDNTPENSMKNKTLIFKIPFRNENNKILR